MFIRKIHSPNIARPPCISRSTLNFNWLWNLLLCQAQNTEGPVLGSFASETADKQLCFPSRAPEFSGMELGGKTNPRYAAKSHSRRKSITRSEKAILRTYRLSPFFRVFTICHERRQKMLIRNTIYKSCGHVFSNKLYSLFHDIFFSTSKCQSHLDLSAPKLFMRLKCSYLRSYTPTKCIKFILSKIFSFLSALSLRN